jgi:tripartite-type tricarboxylate transporter receptor subunit TctC
MGGIPPHSAASRFRVDSERRPSTGARVGRTPDDLVATIAREITGNSDLLARLEKAGVEPMASTPQEFARVIAADSEFWRDIVRELNLKSP